MRRFQALLIAAGLVAAPVGAAAGPSVDVYTQSMSKGRLGVTVLGLTPELREHFGATKSTGVLVGSIEPDSAGARAGLRVGDVIVETNDQLVDDGGDIREGMSGAKKGDKVKLDIVRDRKPMTLEATMTDDAPRSMLESWWLRDFMKSFEELKQPTKSTRT